MQNGPDQGWTWTGNPTEAAVPANGRVPIAADLNTTGQFVSYWDAADSGYSDYSGQVTIG